MPYVRSKSYSSWFGCNYIVYETLVYIVQCCQGSQLDINSLWLSNVIHWNRNVDILIKFLCHWLHRKLSSWQLSLQPVMKISSKWWHSHVSICRHRSVLPDSTKPLPQPMLTNHQLFHRKCSRHLCLIWIWILLISDHTSNSHGPVSQSLKYNKSHTYRKPDFGHHYVCRRPNTTDVCGCLTIMQWTAKCISIIYIYLNDISINVWKCENDDGLSARLWYFKCDSNGDTTVCSKAAVSSCTLYPCLTEVTPSYIFLQYP